MWEELRASFLEHYRYARVCWVPALRPLKEDMKKPLDITILAVLGSLFSQLSGALIVAFLKWLESPKITMVLEFVGSQWVAVIAGTFSLVLLVLAYCLFLLPARLTVHLTGELTKKP